MTDLIALDKQIQASPLADWQKELANFIIHAHLSNKNIRCKYNGVIFEPIDLMKELMKGHFVWGIINWEYTDKKQTYRLEPKNE